jgi:hypothetical protein
VLLRFNDYQCLLVHGLLVLVYCILSSRTIWIYKFTGKYVMVGKYTRNNVHFIGEHIVYGVLLVLVV